ncbi:MAG: hypothetical protein EAZ07_10400 [Cytophagales bacterium]|nr:MAG: hypothetical protein EAZ07_10400 [Cytophagales bacterium]
MCNIIYNNQVFSSENLKISPINRGQLFGDGFFETLLVVNNEVRFFEQHWNRLYKAVIAHKMELPDSLQKSELLSQINSLLKTHLTDKLVRIRITCWRDGEGLYTPNSKQLNYLISSSKGSLAPTVKPRGLVFKEIYKQYSPLSFCKSLNANVYIYANLAKNENQCDEMIVLGANEEIAECSSSNIFLIKDDTVITPSLSSGCIEGIVRSEIIKWCYYNGIKVEERTIGIEELQSVDFVFTANITGLSRIEKIEDKNYKSTSKIYDLIFNNFSIILQ